MDVVVMQRKIGYVLRIPMASLPKTPPRYVRLICNTDVILARFLMTSTNYAYYRVYNRYAPSLMKYLETDGSCTLEFYDDENTLKYE